MERVELHLNKFKILPEIQSDFHKGHEFCASLFKVTDDIMRLCNNGKFTQSFYIT